MSTNDPNSNAPQGAGRPARIYYLKPFIKLVVTKENIRTGCDAAALDQLLKDNKERKITKAIYYAEPEQPGEEAERRSFPLSDKLESGTD